MAKRESIEKAWFRGLLAELVQVPIGAHFFGANTTWVARRVPRLLDWEPDAGWYASLARVGASGTVEIWHDRYLARRGDPHLGVWLRTSAQKARSVAARLRGGKGLRTYTWADRDADGFLRSAAARTERGRIGRLFVDDWRDTGDVFVGGYVAASPHLRDSAEALSLVVAAMRRLADATTARRRQPKPVALAERYAELVTRVARPNQRALRSMLIERHGGRCVISGCTEQLALDAAHIDPVAKQGADHPDNGLLLRADLHRLFDAGLLTIICDKGKPRVAIAPELSGSEYAQCAGREVAGLTRGQRARLMARNRLWTRSR